jgi:hypothetical protein
MLRVPRKLAFFAAAIAVLALGAVSYGSVVGFAATSPSASGVTQPAPSPSEPAESTTTPETAGPNERNEPHEPHEAVLPGGGHADMDSIQADIHQEGVN